MSTIINSTNRRSARVAADEADVVQAVDAAKLKRKPRSFVDAKQRFIALFATERAWAYVLACIALLAFAIVGLDRLQILGLEDMLSKKQVVIVGETTAKQLVPLWPNGVGSMTCDPACVEGSLMNFIGSFRGLEGPEYLPGQPKQKAMQDKAAAFVAAGTPVVSVLNQYYQRYPPYKLSASGIQLEVTDLHVDVDHQMSGRYIARWRDVVTDVRNHRQLGIKAFSASIDARVDPAAREESKINDNPGGVFVTDMHIFEGQ